MLREEHSERQERLRLIPVEEKYWDCLICLPITSNGNSDVSEISFSPGGEERKAAQALQDELARS